ncbi:PQQ-binding-like beta-propeller repeat protein [Segetibacter koreensis]|uniref:outer membrane protein assembly factor BamB family protein n=1 Tax=Segetibacter koreensis TaxID=398037 RepID=UPI00037DD715|nr:PQQ-binding-like beta-propeller repeat protein [Segetibacter koreensis]
MEEKFDKSNVLNLSMQTSLMFKKENHQSCNYRKLISFMLLLTLFSSQLIAQDKKLWLMGGQNLNNTRNAVEENTLSAKNVSDLTVKWTFTTSGDVSATPAVDEDGVYFPDWGGNLYKVNSATGAQVWSKMIKDYTGQVKGLARATPALSGNTLVIGTQLGFPFEGAYVLGINKMTGALLWKTKVEDHPLSIVTQSATINDGKVYVGVASQEEGFAADNSYPCCSFRGSMLCLDLSSGHIIWKTYMLPEGKGFAGNAVWGSTPVVDMKRNSLFITTGNNYKVPQAILDCRAVGGGAAAVKTCIEAVPGSAENYIDAIVAIDLKTGAIKWTKSALPFDAWTVACFIPGSANCPENAGPDYDFGQGPALFSAGTGANKRELLGAGQKSGTYWAVDPDNGAEVWRTEVGPGSSLGGLEWGSAVDDKQIYTAVANYYYIPHLMTKGPGAGNTVKGGFWAALDATTGVLNWEYAADKLPAIAPPPGTTAPNLGMVTIANGVMFGGALDEKGTMYALNAATGEKLWSFESGGSVNSGAAVVKGNVYWGSGYSNFGLGTPNNKLYAFYVPNKNNNANSIVARSSAISNKLDQLNTSNKSISIYPSPAKDVLQVMSIDKSMITSIRLFDLSGKLVKDFRPSQTSSAKLAVGSIKTGSYVIKVSTTTSNLSTQVLVVH